MSQDESDHDGQRIHRAREAVGQIVNTVRHLVGAGDEAARLINHQHDEQSWPLPVPNPIPCLCAYLRAFRAAFVTGTTVMADATPALFWRGKTDRQHFGDNARAAALAARAFDFAMPALRRPTASVGQHALTRPR